MFCDDGDVIFYYKSSPNWIRPGSTYYEFMIVYDDDDECHKIKEFNKYVNDSLEIFDREPKGKIGCTFEAILTIDEFRQIGEILEKHKELITVNTEIYNHVCDGSNEEFYFQALSFNRSCRVKQDENLIVFIPFPILGLPSGSIFEACLYNSIDYIFEMSEKAVTNIKNLFIIYMTSDNKLALRSKKQFELEFFDCDSITKFLRNDLKRIEHL